MITMTDWIGQAEDLTITYDAVVSQNNLLAESISEKTGLPSVIYPTSENLREVVEVDWTDNVKKADRTDYLLAITSGAIAGLIDSFFVGKFSLERANEWGCDKANKFVMSVASLKDIKAMNYLGQSLSWRENFPLLQIVKQLTLEEGCSIIFVTFHIISAYVV